MSEMENLLYIIREQNKLFERIAKALERAFPPLIITATDKSIEPTKLKELIESTCSEEAIEMGFRVYDPVTRKWSTSGE